MLFRFLDFDGGDNSSSMDLLAVWFEQTRAYMDLLADCFEQTRAYDSQNWMALSLQRFFAQRFTIFSRP